MHDRQTGATERVSVDSAGNQGNDGSWLPAISADGRYVAFQSYASNLVPGDTNGCSSNDCADIFLHDRAPPVGGIAEHPNIAESVGGSSSPPIGALAGIAAAGVIVLMAGGWYGRRRWLRRTA